MQRRGLGLGAMPHWPGVGLGDISLGSDVTVPMLPTEQLTAAQNWVASASNQASATSDFYGAALQKLGGNVSSVGGQALSAVNGWVDDAKSAVLSNLDPNLAPIANTAIQSIQAVVHGGGVNAESFTAVAGLIAGSIGGPVAGAVVGSMMATVNLAGKALIAVFGLFGLDASQTVAINPNLAGNGWPLKSQIIPNGPNDRGDGSYSNPGWQSIIPQLHQMQVAGLFTCGNLTTDVNARTNGGGLIDAPRLEAWMKTLPSYLNGVVACASDTQVQPWCEMQSTPATDFRWYFYQLLYHNVEFRYNDSPLQAIKYQDLLHHAASVWNSTHLPGTPQVYRAKVPEWGADYYPSTISQIMAGLWDQDVNGVSAPGMSPIAIYTGELIAIHQRAVNTAAAAAAAATATASAASSKATVTKVAASAGVVVGAATLGTVAYSAATGKAVTVVVGGAIKGLLSLLRFR